MRRASKVTAMHDALSAEELVDITRINPNRLNFLLAIKAVRASVETSHGRGHHHRFSFVDAFVASIYDLLGDGGISSKRVNNAIGSEIYGVATDLYRMLNQADAEKLSTFSSCLLVVEPRPPGRMWRCELVGLPKSGTTELVTLASALLPPDKVPLLSSARRHALVFPIGALCLELYNELKARVFAARRQVRTA
jgi:hypothetical protein